VSFNMWETHIFKVCKKYIYILKKNQKIIIKKKKKPKHQLDAQNFQGMNLNFEWFLSTKLAF
jgi:hypothetical protein